MFAYRHRVAGTAKTVVLHAADALLLTFFALTLGASTLAVNESLTTSFREPKWHSAMMVGAVGGAVIVALRLCGWRELTLSRAWRRFEDAAMAVCAANAILSLLQCAGVVMQIGAPNAVCFDNVAGLASCLCLSLPLGLERIATVRFPAKVAFVTAKLITVAAIMASGSRTGLLCVFLCALFIFSRNRVGKYSTLPLAMIMVAVAIIMVLFSKTDSSRGRWFILCRSAELAAEKPLLGHGHGGFVAHYMDTQADYFAMNPDDQCAMLADNVRHPLCEYMLIAVDYGLCGLAILVVAVAALVAYHCCHKSEDSRTAMLSLSCLSVFAAFSYPLSYPFTWMAMGASLVAILRPMLSRHPRSLSAVALALLAMTAMQTWRNQAIATELADVQRKAAVGLSELMMPRYERLYPNLRNDYRFLYNYAAMQFEAGRYEDALRTARECKRLLADYDLCLLTGDIHRALGHTKDAIDCYQRAHHSCPVRFAPLYEQYLLYRSMGDTAKAKRMASIILAKPVKVASAETLQMIDNVKRDSTWTKPKSV